MAMMSMPMGAVRAAALLAVLVAAGCAPLQQQSLPPRQPPGCAVALAEEVPATIAQNVLVVDAAVGPQPLRLLVDTGATGGGALSEQAVRRLGLNPEPGSVVVTTVAGLMVGAQRVRVPELRIGELPPASVTMAVMPPEASGMLTARADGLLGAEVLSRYDIEIDPEAGRMRFHAVTGCRDGLVPFAEPYQVLPLRFGNFQLLYVHLRVDGTDLLGLVDTGFNGAILILAAGAQRLGLDAAATADLAQGAGRDFAGQVVELRVRRAASVQIGAFQARDVPVTIVAPQAGAPPPFVGADALLGAGFLLSRRVWISYATGRLYVAVRPAGGR